MAIEQTLVLTSSPTNPDNAVYRYADRDVSDGITLVVSLRRDQYEALARPSELKVTLEPAGEALPAPDAHWEA